MRILKQHTAKKKTISGHLSKTTFTLYLENNIISLYFRQIVLLEGEDHFGFEVIKKYKDKTLVENVFVIKADTLNEALKCLNKQNPN